MIDEFICFTKDTTPIDCIENGINAVMSNFTIDSLYFERYNNASSNAGSIIFRLAQPVSLGSILLVISTQ